VDIRTLPDLLAWRASVTPSAPAYCIKRDTAWKPITWAEFARGAEAVARSLAAHGVGSGDRIGILGPTCIEWEYLQWGALRVGAVAVGLDTNYRDDTLHALLRALRLAALAVRNESELQRVPVELRVGLKVVAMFEEPAAAAVPSISVRRVVTSGYGADDATRTIPGPNSEDAAIVVFSSGTTGDPKPITYSHGQVLLAIDAILHAFPDIGPESRFACWLPLANLFQRIINFCALKLGAVSYIVTDPRSLMSELRSISPSILIGVPRFYERLHAGISAEVGAAAGWRGAVARWALRLAERRAAHVASPADRASAWLADLVVYSRVRGTFGSKLRYLVSGSAPMARRLLDWYEVLGLPLYEAYGVSQDIVPVAMNRPGVRRLGTVGKPLSANEVRLADDGEILVGGPGVYREAPAASADGRGAPREWPTGDLGRFDDDGFLTIIGRKAEVFKSAAGRWIAPQRVEAALRSLAYLDDVMVVGAGRPAPVALVYLKWDALPEAQDTVRRENASRPGQLAGDVRRILERDFANATAALPKDEQPKAVILIEQGFTIEGGELTSNLKLRRHIIEARYRPQIDNAYRELESASAPGTGSAASYPLVLPSA
jgi:long-chain acyl-CoA synthetase